MMRAKFVVSSVERFADHEGNTTQEYLRLTAVGRSEAYPEDGSDEDNTFARFTPSADLTICIANPELLGKFEQGQKFYADFTPAE